MPSKTSILNTYTLKESTTEKFTKPLRGVLGGRTIQAGKPSKDKKIYKFWERVLLGSFLFTVGLPYTLVAGGVLAFSKPKVSQLSKQKSDSSLLIRVDSKSPLFSKLNASQVSSSSKTFGQSLDKNHRDSINETPTSPPINPFSPKTSVDSNIETSVSDPKREASKEEALDFKGWISDFLNTQDKQLLSKLFGKESKIDFNTIEIEKITAYPPKFSEEPKIYFDGSRFLLAFPIVVQKEGKLPKNKMLCMEPYERKEWDFLIGDRLYGDHIHPFSDENINFLKNLINGEEVEGFGYKLIRLYHPENDSK